ncbi:MAG TPA: hypothetical protein VL326_13455 [Kofleriaceae bacterium]|jgi:hypothetical protein|nr:hypothetical protein [Kofleriaceae bacterium]
MQRLAVVISLTLLAACGGGASYQISIRNASARPIEELYVYPTGTARGTSRGQLAPNASTAVKMKGGHVSVTAISAKINIDEHTRDKPTADQTVELNAPVELVFYDDGAPPPGIEKKGVIGVAFQIPKPTPHPDEGGSPTPDEPSQPAPAPQAP